MELKFFIRLPPQGNAVLFHSTIYNLEQKTVSERDMLQLVFFFSFLCAVPLVIGTANKLLLLSSKLLYILGTS